jgi:hypothetical protein
MRARARNALETLRMLEQNARPGDEWRLPPARRRLLFVWALCREAVRAIERERGR